MMHRNEVNTAFEILIEEIELVANGLYEEGAGAVKAGNYNNASRAIEERIRLEGFREKVKALQKEWASCLLKGPQREGKARRPGTTLSSRTPEHDFRRPILEALVAVGGQATLGRVLELVEKKMKAKLTKHDLEPLASDSKEIRWRNAARWPRRTLVGEGLMKAESPFGIWEISDSGRKALQSENP